MEKIMTSGTHADLVARLRKFVTEYRKIQRLDPEMVYALHSEYEERFAPLLLSDLEAAADALAARPPAETQADPPALVALVAEWRQAVTAPLVPPPEMDDNAARTLYRRARSDRADAAHKALLAYPLSAAPPVTDTPQGWTREPRR